MGQSTGSSSSKKNTEESKPSNVFENFGDPEAAKEIVSDLARDAADLIRKHPLQSVLGAAAIGFILGSCFRRK